MPRMAIWLVWLVSNATPGVNRAMSAKSSMPFWLSVSWLKAVMLIGTLLMFSSRRVAVTTISSRPPAAAVSVVFASPAPAKGAAQTPVVTRRVRNSNRCAETRWVNGFEEVVCIVLYPRKLSLRDFVLQLPRSVMPDCLDRHHPPEGGAWEIREGSAYCVCCN